jgi:hypothetical protein
VPRIRKISFEAEGKHYSLDFRLDDAAIVDNTLSIDVVAEVGEPLKRSYSKTLTAQLDYAKRVIRINDRTKMLYYRPIESFKDPGSLQEDAPTANPNEDDALSGEAWDAATEIVEQGIDAMPATDPLVGCLLRAGLSTIIGQLLRCYNATWRSDGAARLKSVLDCLKKNGITILGRASKRFLKCALALGFA